MATVDERYEDARMDTKMDRAREYDCRDCGQPQPEYALDAEGYCRDRCETVCQSPDPDGHCCHYKLHPLNFLKERTPQ